MCMERAVITSWRKQSESTEVLWEEGKVVFFGSPGVRLPLMLCRITHSSHIMKYQLSFEKPFLPSCWLQLTRNLRRQRSPQYMPPRRWHLPPSRASTQTISSNTDWDSGLAGRPLLTSPLLHLPLLHSPQETLTGHPKTTLRRVMCKPHTSA